LSTRIPYHELIVPPEIGMSNVHVSYLTLFDKYIATGLSKLLGEK